MGSIIATVVIGFVAGLVARMLKPGSDSMGFIMTTILGIAGSFAANYAGAALGLYQPGQAAGFIASVVGAVVLLFLWGIISKNMK